MKSRLSLLSMLVVATILWVLLPAKPGAAGDAACASGKELTAGLCYTKCQSGYTAAATMCVPGCPSGFRNDGLYCAKPSAYGRGAGYPWKFGDRVGSLDGARARCTRANPQGCEKDGQIIYPVCRSGFHKVGCCICSPNCPANTIDIGVSCQKRTYDRGAGTMPPSLGGTCTVDYSSRFANGTPRRYDQMTWLTQHNAFATSDDHWVHVMSTFNISKQLNGGVRALMLDIHDYDGKVMICHANCTGAAGSNYALPRKTLADELAAVKTFLDANPSEILTIIFESNISNAARINAEIASAGLSSQVYDPEDDPEWKVGTRDPSGVVTITGSWPTIDWMVQRNRRLVIFSSKSGDSDSQIGAVYQYRYTVENTYDLGATGQNLDCSVREYSSALNTPGRMFVMNHFRALPNLVAAQEDNQKDKIVNRFKNVCQSQTVNPPSFLAVDFYHHPYCNAADAVNELNALWR